MPLPPLDEEDVFHPVSERSFSPERMQEALRQAGQCQILHHAVHMIHKIIHLLIPLHHYWFLFPLIIIHCVCSSASSC